MFLLGGSTTFSVVRKAMTNEQTLVITIGLVILMIGPYSKPPSLSHVIPYLLAAFILISNHYKKTIYLDRMLLQFAIVYLASLIPIIIYSFSNLQLTLNLVSGLDNLIRVIPLILIGIFLRGTRIIELVLAATLIVSLLLVIMLFLYPQQIRAFFITWYSDPTKALQSINMRRGIATMASPAGLGYFAILSIIYFALQGKVLSGNNKKTVLLNLLFMLLAIIIGVFSVSKTFFLGLITLFFILIFMVLVQNIRKKRFSVISLQVKKVVPRIVLILIVVVLLLQLAAYYVPGFGNTWNYFMGVLNDPFTEALSGRYDNVLLGMQDMILEVFPLGYGFFSSRYGDVFIGDSGYLLMLFMGGIFTFSLYYLSLILLGTKNRYLFIIISLGLFVDLGRPAFWGSRASDLLWILVGFWYYSSKERQHENQTLRA